MKNKFPSSLLFLFVVIGIPGLCFSAEAIEGNITEKVIQKVFQQGPSIREVHQWAIDYAEVNQEKIVNWRKLAKKRAWIPKVTLGVDGDKKRTVSDSVWGSYSSGGQHYLGPDDKSFNSNFSWDASVTWDFADLVWSSDQTSIDVRSRSMVKLREDILEQVTEFYFERRRLQMQALAGSSEDTQIIIQRRLRVDELTALIDALTDGKFSEQVNHN